MDRCTFYLQGGGSRVLTRDYTISRTRTSRGGAFTVLVSYDERLPLGG